MNPVPFILLAISLPLLLGGCGEKEVHSSQLVERNDIKYLVNSETPYTGKQIEFHENGQKQWEENYKDGKIDGLSVWWDVNGQKEGEVNYKDGKKVEGSEKFWSSKGEPVDSEEE